MSPKKPASKPDLKAIAEPGEIRASRYDNDRLEIRIHRGAVIADKDETTALIFHLLIQAEQQWGPKVRQDTLAFLETK
jgi:hypothetical protein